MMRKKTSSHRGKQIDPGIAPEGIAHGQPLGLRPRIATTITPAQFLDPGQRQQPGAVLHDRLVAHAGAVPFQHGELGMVQRRALGVAEHPGELEQPRHAAGQKLLHRELGGAVQPAFALFAVGQLPVGGEAGEMDLRARRHLQDRRLDLDEALGRKPRPHGRLQSRPRLQCRQSLRQFVRAPVGHGRPSHARWTPCRVAT
jgi:hypothetical protein